MLHGSSDLSPAWANTPRILHVNVDPRLRDLSTSALKRRPLVTRQPKNESVQAGQVARFIARASGAPAPHVRWQERHGSGKPWEKVANATSTTYSFTTWRSENGYQYRAVFTNSIGSATTRVATLQVKPVSTTPPSTQPVTAAPVITGQPSSTTVTSGSTAAFSASASGNPSPTVQWQASSNSGSSWSNVTGATSTTYSFTTSVSENGYEYRAAFTNSVGSATTKAATLTVNSATKNSTIIQSAPKSDSVTAGSPYPGNQLATTGGTGTVTFTVTTSNPAFTVSSSGAVSAPDTLGVGNYTVSGTDADTSGDVGTWSFQLTVTARDGTIAQSSPTSGTTTAGSSYSNQLATSGSSGTLTFTVTTSNPAFTVSSSGAVSAPDTLAVNDYTVSGTDADSFGDSGTWSFGLTVTARDGTITQSSPTSGTVTVGSTYSNQLETTGSGGTLTFTVTTSSPAFTVSSTGAVSAPDTLGVGNYTVSGTDADTFGDSGTWSFELTVNSASSGAPTITKQPVNDTVLSGQLATFTASATGNPSPTVQWQVSSNSGSSWSNVTGATSATYSFTTTSSENDNEYQAVFTNSVSLATTNAATLAVGPTGDTSTNWSGYFASGGTFTSVSGSWTVPTVTCTSDADEYSSEWIGIDGATDSTVEQDGVEADCQNGSPFYQAWYEFYSENTGPPKGVSSVDEIPIDESISPGDAMSASVSVASNEWTLKISDSTRNWTFTEGPILWTVPAEASAEWIAERPMVNGSLTSLADFGSVTFTAAAATENGSSESISALGATAIEMTNNGTGTTTLAAPLALNSTNEGFTDYWDATGP